MIEQPRGFDLAAIRRVYVSEQLLDAYCDLCAALGLPADLFYPHAASMDKDALSAFYAAPLMRACESLICAIEAQYEHNRSAMQTALAERVTARAAGRAQNANLARQIVSG